MGLTVLEIDVGNPANPDVTEKIEFLIDSGAIYSVVPTPMLERLGIRPLAEQEFRLANGEKIVRKKGMAVFKYGDRIGGADVIFGQEGDSVLLGAFTLEALGLVLDPLRRELKPLPMILGRLAGRNKAEVRFRHREARSAVAIPCARSRKTRLPRHPSMNSGLRFVARNDDE